MKKQTFITLSILLCILIGCKEKVATHRDVLTSDSTTRLYSKADTLAPKDTVRNIFHPIEPRCFLISYQVKELISNNFIYGETWFDCGGFPRKKDIDSMIYSSLEYEKSCYSTIIITYFFEFKSYADYVVYSRDYKGDMNPKKHKKCSYLKEISEYPVINLDTSITYGTSFKNEPIIIHK